MEIAVYHGRTRIEDTTEQEIMENFTDKQKAAQIISDLKIYGIHVRPIKGTFDSITFKRIEGN